MSKLDMAEFRFALKILTIFYCICLISNLAFYKNEAVFIFIKN